MERLSVPRYMVPGMVKFDPEGFDAMMARIADEDTAAAEAGRYEDMEPTFEYLQMLGAGHLRPPPD